MQGGLRVRSRRHSPSFHGLDPSSDGAKRAVQLIETNSYWDHEGEPYWEGEVEECINGRTVADGAYFGVDVSGIVVRLIGERLDNRGWNCERANGSVRSSFATTINVLEGLLEYESATGGTSASPEARKAGEKFLLARHLFRRLSNGEPGDESFLKFLYPNRWHYDVLRALDYFRTSALLTGDAPIRCSVKLSITFVRGVSPTARGFSTGHCRGEFGSTWMK
jgi:hypothetical protein